MSSKSGQVYLLATVLAGSLLAWRVLGDTAAGGKHDEHTHSHAAPVAAGDFANVSASANTTANTTVAVREVTIEMQDTMRFSPEHLRETVRFTLKNLGKVRHEWVVGSAKELQEHAAQMKTDAQNQTHKHKDRHDHAHGHGGGGAQAQALSALSLAAGEQGTLT